MRKNLWFPTSTTADLGIGRGRRDRTCTQGSRRPTNKLQGEANTGHGWFRDERGHKHAHGVRHERNIPDTFQLGFVVFYPSNPSYG